MAIISIFSGSHCHGDEIAERVSGQLAYPRIEERVLDETERKFGVSKERLGRSMTGPASFLNTFTRERERNISFLKRVLAEMILEDNKLLFGFATHLLPSSISHVLKVCIIANHDYRVAQLAKEASCSKKEADKIIRKDDQERLEWTSELFGKPPYDESLYDIVVPMHSTSVEEAVGIIVTHAGSEQVRTTAHSRQAAEDFVLASEVGIALAKRGSGLTISAHEGCVTITINEYVVRLKHLEDELKNAAMAIKGVREVVTVAGPGFKPPSSNPWANIKAPPKVLLVDDEKEYVHTLSERLETRDIGAAVAYNGEQALDFVEKDEPDVMVLDLMMPGINGIEVLRKIKRQRPHIEVIILTGHGSEREENLARELGAFAYLKKPVDVDALAELMREAYQKAAENKKTSQRDDSGGEEDERGTI